MNRKNEAGQALVFTAVGLVALLGFVGLGIDMGVLRYQKRLQQTAADGAAIAGATNLTYGGVQTGAQNASASNGFTDNTGGGACATPPTNLAVDSVTVTVCNGPIVGPHAGNTNYVEVYVTAGQPTYFMKIFGVNSETITARAVATNLAGGTSGINSGCLYTLGPPTAAIEGVNINGSAILNAPTCGIVDNGNYNTKGNKLDVNAGTFGVSGSANVSGPGGTVTCGGGTTNCPTYGTPASSDPMGSMTPPCTFPCTLPGSAVSINGNGSYTITGSGGGVTYGNGVYTVQPGVYTSFKITGTAGSSVVFNSGLYIFDGNSGNQVTFYFTNDATIQTNGTPTINLSAPSSGTYQGILMWQDKNDTNVGPAPNGPTLGGNSGTQYNGILYFPSDQLTFYGNNVSYSVGVVVSDSLALSGNPTVTFDGAAGVPGGLPPGFTVGNAHLVE
jgi:Flp pilus assembly protein TadG